MRLRISIVAILVLLVSLIAPATIRTSAAPRSQPAQTLALAPLLTPRAGTTTNPLNAIAVTGTFTNTAGLGTFKGLLNVTKFADQNGKLVALGNLNGTLTDAAGTVLKTLTNQATTLPVSASGTCSILHLTLGPLSLNLLGLQVNLNKIVLDITAQSGPGNLLGNLLCDVAHLLDGTPTAGALAGLLNQILSALDGSGTTGSGTNPLNAIAITGSYSSTQGSGTFNGLLNITSFANQNGKLVALGALTGKLTDTASNAVKNVTAQAVAVPVSASGTCSILHLTLGPLSLNLLGLQVNLNKIVLDITAQSGPGNLLGNLLCDVAHLLDNNSALANLLNQILGALNGSTNPLSIVGLTGTLANGGTFNGLFNVTHFANQNGQLMATGMLNGILADAAGSILKTVTNQTISLPVSAVGTCQILHLNLAPTSLNLLGLQVNLSRVVLDITAQAGAGNLLGNLLCAVAHLLDKSPSLSTLSGLLNQILGALGGNPLSAIGITGTSANNSTFKGLLDVTHFANQSGKLVATGTLSGTLTDAAGTVKNVTSQAVTVPVSLSGTCQILHLNLAPTSLNLLGLQVNLSRVVLDITAQSGAGNLLGNLLCGIAHLLDNTNGSNGALAAQLNKLFKLL